MKKQASQEKIEYGIVFGLGMVAMFFCLFSGGLILGDRTLMESDLIGTYIPAMRSFVRNLLSGNSISISWDNCLGSNATAYNAYYVGGSITNLFYVIFFWMNPAVVVVLSILVKAGLAAVAFFYFMKKYDCTDKKATMVFGVFYAAGSYQIFINTINTIWMDAVYILPIILGLIIDLKRSHKWRVLCVAYVYLFLTNFYMAYMVGIFSAIFFLLLILFEEKKKENNKLILEYMGAVVLAVCISAIVLLPTALFIFAKSAPDSTNSLTLNAGLLQIYNQFFLGENGDVMYSLPCIYAGLPTLLLTPFFFAKGVATKGKKWIFGILLGIMSISCFIPCLYLFWHVMDVPDGWPYRFGFMITFLGCVMACFAMEHIEKINKKYIYIWIGINFLIYLGGMYVQKQTETVETNTLLGLAINVGLLLVWYVCLFSRREEVKKYIYVLVLLEVALNGYYMLQIHERPSKVVYETWYENGKRAEQELKKDQDLYRVNIGNDRQFGTDMFFGFNGIGDFGTMENYKVRQTLSALGVYTSPRVTCSEGITPFTQLILGMKYYIPDMYASAEENVVYAYDQPLSFGFMVDDEVANISLTGRNVYENSNRLASAMIGEELSIFRPVDGEKIYMVNNQIGMGQMENGRMCLFAYVEPENPIYMTIRVPDEGKEVYCTFDSGESVIDFSNPYIVDSDTNGEYQLYDYKRLGISFAKRMDLVDAERLMAICMWNGISGKYMEFDDYWIYELFEDQLENFYHQVEGHQLLVNKHKNGHIEGTVEVQDENHILYTSIPYDEGWKVTSKQGNVEIIPLLDGAFLGVKFYGKGKYELIFDYKAPGEVCGMCISVCFIIIFIIICIRKKRIL